MRILRHLLGKYRWPWELEWYLKESLRRFRILWTIPVPTLGSTQTLLNSPCEMSSLLLVPGMIYLFFWRHYSRSPTKGSQLSSCQSGNQFPLFQNYWWEPNPRVPQDTCEQNANFTLGGQSSKFPQTIKILSIYFLFLKNTWAIYMEIDSRKDYRILFWIRVNLSIRFIDQGFLTEGVNWDRQSWFYIVIGLVNRIPEVTVTAFMKAPKTQPQIP